jgi:hypothetical protein
VACGHREMSKTITTDVFLERILFSIDQVSTWSLLKGFLVKERNTKLNSKVAVHIPMDGSSDHTQLESLILAQNERWRQA